jgi:5-(carboxyamino)imidazole ribonucleotide mutase
MPRRNGLPQGKQRGFCSQKYLNTGVVHRTTVIFLYGGNIVKKVAVIMGSISDFDAVKPATDILKELGIPYEAHVYSAHRCPREAAAFAENARQNGFGAIIAAAGKAAHLAGALAAQTTIPVIGIPIKSSTLDGLDALLSTVQMPSGIPVATVAIDGAKNAGLLAAQILSLSDPELAATLDKQRQDMRAAVLEKDAELQKKL